MATALIATSQLLTVDMIPALVHLVYQALQHKEFSFFFDMADELRRLIKSYNVTVLFSCISVLHDFILADPSSFRDLVPFFSELLIKIVTGQFDPAYDFDTLPAPWVQMKVIRVSGVARV